MNRPEESGTYAMPAFGAGQRYLTPGLFALLLILRVAYAFQFRFDTDEPQHLHVVWGWTRGLMQYRDIFDNHGPVFHLLCAPLLRLIGERPDILILMRLAMIPLLGITLWCVYRIGANLFSRTVGMWAAIFTAFFPEFFLTSTEFRTDNLWTVLWLLAMVIATGKAVRPGNAFLIGLLLGTAFGVTVKSGLMVGSVSMAAMFIIGRQWILRKAVNWRNVFACAFAGLLGLLVVPSVLTLWFSAQGALKDFLYCNITHNLVPHAQNWKQLDAHVLWFPVFTLLAVGTFVRLGKREFEPLDSRRIFLFLVAGAYFTALKSFFPTLTRQDDLPVIPLFVLIVTSCIPMLRTRLATLTNLGTSLNFIPTTIVTAEIALMLVTTPVWKNRTKEDIAMVADVLRATGPWDYVMDATGETMFRRRPYHFALEAFTKVRIEQGSIKDDIIERLIETRTILVRPQDLTRKAKDFVRDNYVPIGHGLSMLGKVLRKKSSETSRDPIAFDVIISGRYSIVGKGMDSIAGTLDGTPINGPRLLEAGKHVLQSDIGTSESIALFATDGVERKFSPFLKD